MLPGWYSVSGSSARSTHRLSNGPRASRFPIMTRWMDRSQRDRPESSAACPPSYSRTCHKGNLRHIHLAGLVGWPSVGRQGTFAANMKGRRRIFLATHGATGQRGGAAAFRRALTAMISGELQRRPAAPAAPPQRLSRPPFWLFCGWAGGFAAWPSRRSRRE